MTGIEKYDLWIEKILNTPLDEKLLIIGRAGYGVLWHPQHRLFRPVIIESTPTTDLVRFLTWGEMKDKGGIGNSDFTFVVEHIIEWFELIPRE